MLLVSNHCMNPAASGTKRAIARCTMTSSVAYRPRSLFGTVTRGVRCCADGGCFSFSPRALPEQSDVGNRTECRRICMRRDRPCSADWLHTGFSIDNGELLPNTRRWPWSSWHFFPSSRSVTPCLRPLRCRQARLRQGFLWPTFSLISPSRHRLGLRRQWITRHLGLRDATAHPARRFGTMSIVAKQPVGDQPTIVSAPRNGLLCENGRLKPFEQEVINGRDNLHRRVIRSQLLNPRSLAPTRHSQLRAHPRRTRVRP